LKEHFMKIILFVSSALGALMLQGCASTPGPVGSTNTSNLATIANKIDNGAQLALADLPSACQIVGQVAALASAYSASGLASGGAASTIAKSANGAAALANSPLCVNPATANPIAASIQLLGAVAAIKSATSGGVSAPTAAALLGSGG
jgi:hypothetical protein